MACTMGVDRGGADTMARFRVLDLLISERADDKMGIRGIGIDQVLDMLDNPYVVDRNRRNRAAEYLFIGRDNSGRCITVPILPADEPEVWRAVTAWYCKPSEAAKLR